MSNNSIHTLKFWNFKICWCIRKPYFSILQKVTEMFHYAIATKAKFLHISCAYYIFREDVTRVGLEFQRFNEDFHRLQEWYTHLKEFEDQFCKCLGNNCLFQ